MEFDQSLHLKNIHKKRRQKTISCVEQAINELRATKQPINFSKVAKQSGVGKSTLYSIPAIKEKIIFYREDSLQKSYNQTRTSSKQDVLIQSLKRKVSSLEKENKELQQRLKLLYGELFEKTMQTEELYE